MCGEPSLPRDMLLPRRRKDTLGTLGTFTNDPHITVAREDTMEMEAAMGDDGVAAAAAVACTGDGGELRGKTSSCRQSGQWQVDVFSSLMQPNSQMSMHPLW